VKAAYDQALEHIGSAWRFRKAAVIAAAAAAVAGWLVVLAWPDSFEASSRVFVNTSTALRPLLQGIAVDQDIDAQLNMVRESLLGRPRLERVARDADLDIKAKSPEELDRLIARLQKTILIDAQAPRSSGGRENRSSDSIYTITYRHSSRDKALSVVRSLLNALMEDTMSGKRTGADAAQRFLVEQIKDYEKRLSDAEARLANFKRKNVGLVPGEQGDYFSRLQNEMAASKKAASQLEVAQRRRAELERQLHGDRPFSASPVATAGGAGAGGARVGAGGGDTATRIDEAQAKLDDLLLRYTDKHPDVVAARETLSQLKERQKLELEALRRGDPSAAASSGLAANPVYQNIQLQMNQVDVDIASLRAELADHQRTESELRRLVTTAPEVEAEFARLMRDYTVEKTQYTALVDRLEKAKMGEDAADTGIVQFQIINPPTADLQPVAPNRPLLLSAVLAAAIAIGAGFAWFLSQLNPVFINTHVLAETTGLPVLGSVRRAWAERYEGAMRRSLYKLAGAMAGLLVGFTLVLLAHEQAARILHRLLPV
jgi:polysaccharide chain length determinant protein (PEP-CTERM system associated)